MLAARSNEDATGSAQPVDAGAVKDAHSTYSVDAERDGDARSTCSRCSGSATTSGGSTYVTRVLPGLTLKARQLERATRRSPSPTPATR